MSISAKILPGISIEKQPGLRVFTAQSAGGRAVCFCFLDVVVPPLARKRKLFLPISMMWQRWDSR